MNQSTREQIDLQFSKNQTNINLNRKQLRDQQLQYLFIKKEIAVIKLLQLEGNQFSYLALRKMKEANWNNLQSLNLRYNNIGKKACKQLSKVKFPQLEEIFFYKNGICSPGLSYLTKAQWPKLNFVGFNHNDIKLDGIILITRAIWSKSLRKISIDGNGITFNDIHRILLLESPQIRLIYVDCDFCPSSDLRDKFKAKLAEKKSQIQFYLS